MSAAARSRILAMVVGEPGGERDALDRRHTAAPLQYSGRADRLAGRLISGGESGGRPPASTHELLPLDAK